MTQTSILSQDQINLIIEKLGGEEAALSFLNSDLENNKWTEKDGVIYFSVISNGRTAEEWLDFFKRKGDVSEFAEPLLFSKYFKSTNGVLTEVAIIKKKFRKKDPDYEEEQEVELRAEYLKFKQPNPEVICLIAEKFSIDDFVGMNLDWLLSMHKPIYDKNDSEMRCLSVSFEDSDYYLDGDMGAHTLCYNSGLNGGFIYAKSRIKIKI